MSRILHHVGRKDFKKTRQRQIGEQRERAAQKLKELQENEEERKQIEEAARPYKSNWRSDLSESMTTAGLGMINYEAEGDANLESVYDSISLNANNVDSGNNDLATSSTLDVTKYDTIKFTVTQLTSGTQGLRLFGNYGSNSNQFFIIKNDLKANPVVSIPSSYKNRSNFRFQIRSFNEDPGNMATYRVSASLQRRTPINVFVSLDSPEANNFIRTDPTMQGLSAAQREKKLLEMLESGDEYLLKQLGITGSSARPSETIMPDSWEQAATYGGKEAEDRKKIKDALNNPKDPFYLPPGTGQPGKGRGMGDRWLPSASTGGTDTQIAGSQSGERGTGGKSAGDPANIQWPRDRPGGAQPGPGYRPPKASRKQPQYAHYEPQGEVLSEKRKLKKVKDISKKIPGYYDGKPSPVGFPMDEPPKMINGFHPDLIDGKKVADRFNKMDPISARSMPATGNPHIDKRVKAAAKKRR